jgi:hypothetical protein
MSQTELARYLNEPDQVKLSQAKLARRSALLRTYMSSLFFIIHVILDFIDTFILLYIDIYIAPFGLVNEVILDNV